MVVNDKIKLFKISLILIGIFIVLSWGINDVSAATISPSSIYVSNQGNNSWDGCYSVWNGTSGPKATIENATQTVSNNGNIYIASGIYNENGINLNKNITIQGENQYNTIINGMNTGQIFNISQGINVNLNNLTFINGSSIFDNVSGAISNSGNLTILNCSFINNTAVNGGAIYNFNELTINNSAFVGNSVTGIGGAIYDDEYGLINVSECNFIDNSANGGAGAIMSENDFNNITNCNFEGNTAEPTGGAIICDLGSTYLTNDNFNDNNANFGGALLVDNSYVSNCSFTDNNATSYWGGGAVYSTGNNTVLNCTFTSNNALNFYGGAFYITSNTTLINDTFDNNTGEDGGAIEISTGIVFIFNCSFNLNSADNEGGAIDNCGDLNLTTSIVMNNSAYDGGAIDNYGNNANLNLTSCNLINNSATDLGGAISNLNGGLANINFNRIIGNIANTDSLIYNDDTNGSINATLNWWGSNNDPSDNVSTAVDVSPWLILTTLNTPTINPGSNTTLTVDLQHDSNNLYHDPVNGHVPDGISAIFNDDSFGNLNPITGNIIDGQVSSTYIAGTNIGTSNPTITVDNQTIPGNIVISDDLTNITVTPVSVNYNGQANLTATLTDSNGIPIANQQITFYVDGVNVGNSTTSSLGIANLEYSTIQNVGIYDISAAYTGNSVYVSNISSSSMIINLIPTQIILGSNNGLKGSTTNLNATLTDTNNTPLVGQQVTFYVNSVNVGTAITNTNGVATLSYIISINPGNYNITSLFNGNSQYSKCNSISTLEVTIPPTTTISINGGLYNTNKIVTLTMNEAGNIYYTLNGNTPTTSSTKYTNPLTITSTITLKYLAVNLAGNKSSVYTQTYTIDKVPPKVLSTSPKNLAQHISRTVTITLKFSENIKPSTDWSKIYVRDLNTGKIIKIDKIISGDTLTIKTGTKSANQWYQIYIPAAAVKDNAGNNNAITTFRYKTN